jgi:hypothetical protein
LISIQEGRAKVKSSYGEVEVPLERISEIQMATDGTERARRNREDIRVVFAGTTAVTFALNKMDQANLTGKSENFGEMSLPVAAARLIEYNIYKKRLADPVEDAVE